MPAAKHAAGGVSSGRAGREAGSGGTRGSDPGAPAPDVPATGDSWSAMPGTRLTTVCPPNDFGGSGYEFGDRCGNVLAAWNSGALDTKRNRLVFLGGGHEDYAGNELYALELGTRRLVRLTDPGVPIAGRGATQGLECGMPAIVSGTQPNSRHTYDGVAYVEHADVLLLVGGSCFPTGYRTRDIWAYSFTSQAWSLKLTAAQTGLYAGDDGYTTAYDPVTELVFISDSTAVFAYDFGRNRIDMVARLDGFNSTYGQALLVPDRRWLLLFNHGAGNLLRVDITQPTSPTVSVLATTGGASVVAGYFPGLTYNRDEKVVVAWPGGRNVYRLDLNDLRWSTQAIANPPTATANGVFERFTYSSATREYVTIVQPDDDARYWRP